MQRKTIEVDNKKLKDKNSYFGFTFGEKPSGESVIELDYGWIEDHSFSGINTKLDVFYKVLYFGNDKDLEKLIENIQYLDVENKASWISYLIRDQKYYHDKIDRFIRNVYDSKILEDVIKAIINSSFIFVYTSTYPGRKKHTLEILNADDLKNLKKVQNRLKTYFDSIDKIESKEFKSDLMKYSYIATECLDSFISNKMVKEVANKRYQNSINVTRMFEDSKYKRKHGLNNSKKQRKGRK